ncbi:MAG: pantoate--beta-alanine ligase [Bacteroidota bacterium]|nr:pantoate--beta-alanine ligase [Bacteroidota bacterium]
MIIFKTVQSIGKVLSKLILENKKIGFVPTMGALHNGHLSLIEQSKKQADITVCSIFVNPTQFNDQTDFQKYPVTIEHDILLLEEAGCDVLFLPSVHEMYPQGTALKQPYDLGFLETLLEGKYRPGHFQGVCQVVHRLLSIVKPQVLFLGQKDYQQCMVISKMIELEALPVELILGPTHRENSGLAMSSRNMRLSDEGKQKAVAIFNSMQYIKEHITQEDVEALQKKSIDQLLKAGFDSVDYIAICNAHTLAPIHTYQPGKKLVVLVAAFIEGVRLIDNLMIN